MKPTTLMVPGPVQVGSEILDKMALPQIPHYSDEAIALYRECIERLKLMFNTGDRGNVYLFPGSGSVAMEVSSATFINRGDKVVTGVNGIFGERVKSQAEMYGARTIEVRAREGEAVTPEMVEKVLEKHQDAKMVMMVHLETSTGVLNPVEEIGRIVKKHGAIYVVDAVSSLGTEHVEMEAWNAHICGSASQKGLESPPGVGIVAVSRPGMEALEHSEFSGTGWFLNLQVWNRLKEGKEIRKGIIYPLPVTMPVNNIAALAESLRRIGAEGLKNRLERHAKIAQAVRLGLKNIGFDLFPEERYCASGVTSMRNSHNVNVAELIEFLKKKVNIEISNGLFDLYNKIFRIGHIGMTANRESIVPVLFGIEEYLRKEGKNVSLGSSLSGVSDL